MALDNKYQNRDIIFTCQMWFISNQFWSSYVAFFSEMAGFSPRKDFLKYNKKYDYVLLPGESSEHLFVG